MMKTDSNVLGGNSIKRVILRIIHTSCDKYCTIIKVYHYAHKFMSVINQRKTILNVLSMINYIDIYELFDKHFLMMTIN